MDFGFGSYSRDFTSDSKDFRDFMSDSKVFKPYFGDFWSDFTEYGDFRDIGSDFRTFAHRITEVVGPSSSYQRAELELISYVLERISHKQDLSQRKWSVS